MKHLFTSSLSKSLLPKLALSLALILMGSSPALADDIVIFEEGDAIPSGWTANSYISVSNQELVSSGDTPGYITSSSTYTFSNKNLVVVAQRTTNTESYIRLSSGSGYSYTPSTTLGYGGTIKTSEMYSLGDYIMLISEPINVTGQNLRVTIKNAKVKSVKLIEQPLILDETIQSALSEGKKTASVYFKYTPVSGWNSLCVPFQLKQSSSYNHFPTFFGEDYKVYTLSSYSDNTLTFSNALPYSYSGVNANVPCLVYTTTPQSCPVDGFELTSNVTIKYSTNPSATAGDATFQGTYAPIAAGAMPDGSYGLTPSGQIRKAGSGASLKGYRGYFTGISAPSTGVKMIVIDEDGGETDLGIVKMVDEKANDVYTLAGQKVQKGRKGIYIVNGKKVVIK